MKMGALGLLVAAALFGTQAAAQEPEPYVHAGYRNGLFFLRSPDDVFRLYVQGRVHADWQKPLGNGVSQLPPDQALKGGFFLKELFVEDVARGSGVGRQLLQAVARIALERGLKRVDWTADRNNPDLLDYYDRTGAVREEDKVFFRLAGDALTKFAERQDD